MEDVFITSLTREEVGDIFRSELKSIFKELNINQHAGQLIKSDQDEEFDISGLAAYLKCSINTIHNLKRDGLIPFYRLGRKVYFKKSEIDRAAKINRFLERIMS